MSKLAKFSDRIWAATRVIFTHMLMIKEVVTLLLVFQYLFYITRCDDLSFEVYLVCHKM